MRSLFQKLLPTWSSTKDARTGSSFVWCRRRVTWAELCPSDAYRSSALLGGLLETREPGLDLRDLEAAPVLLEDPGDRLPFLWSEISVCHGLHDRAGPLRDVLGAADSR